MDLKISFNIGKFNQHMNDLVKAIENSMQPMAEEIREKTLKNVMDRNYWDGWYSPKSVQAGQKYDLDYSGQLLSTIQNPNYNTITTNGDGFKFGIGNIAVLDSLRSKKQPYGIRDLHDTSAPYWRFVVFGHHETKSITFTYDGVNGGKDVGAIVPTNGPPMNGTEPIHMFDRGLYNTLPQVPYIVNGHIKQALSEVDKKWK